jgi:guanylate cyclase
MRSATSDEPGPGIIRRLLEIGVDPSDDADLRNRKRVATGAVYALLGFGLTWVVTGTWSSQPGPLLVSVTFLVATAAVLGRFIANHDVDRFIWWEAAIGLVTCALGQVALGGFAGSSGSIVWGVITPIATVLFFGPERAMRWFYAYLAVIVVLVAADPFMRSWANTPYGFNLAFFGINTVGPAAIGFLMIRYMDRQRRAAQARSEELLLNVLPAPIANRLRSGEGVIAEQHAAVTVLFADVVDFTPYAEVTPPTEVVRLLNAIFSDFDTLADRFGMEKIKTIGDAYMAVAGVPAAREDHADCALRMGLAMLESVGRHRDAHGQAVTLRIGIASGPVVAGVIGRRKFIYDLWGDTVNTASRMESSGLPGRIQVTPGTRELLTDPYPFERRDGVAVKGKGTMTTYLLDPAAIAGAASAAPGASAPTPA